jgi:hypothetical protein
MKLTKVQSSITVSDGKPIDKRMRVWTDSSWVYPNIPAADRYEGLAVPVFVGTHVTDYAWGSDLSDAGLKMRIYTTRLTTAQRDALTGLYEGYEIYNLTTHTKEFWDGTVWKTIATV